MATTKVDIGNVGHPLTHPASIIVQDSTHRFMTAAEKAFYSELSFKDMSVVDLGVLTGDAVIDLAGKGESYFLATLQDTMPTSVSIVNPPEGPCAFALFIINSNIASDTLFTIEDTIGSITLAENTNHYSIITKAPMADQSYWIQSLEL